MALLRFPQSQSERYWKEGPKPWDHMVSQVTALEGETSYPVVYTGNITSTSSLGILKRSMLEGVATRSLC